MNKVTEPFKFLGNYDVSTLIGKLHLLDWEKEKFRSEQRFKSNSVKTAPLIWEDTFRYVNRWPEYEFFSAEVYELQEKMEELFGEGMMYTCVFANLLSGENIPMHIDLGSGGFFENTHRVHIPILTNDDVLFRVGEEEKNMKVGEMWEINNSHLPHGVFNYGKTDRIHLMIDWKFNCD